MSALDRPLFRLRPLLLRLEVLAGVLRDDEAVVAPHHLEGQVAAAALPAAAEHGAERVAEYGLVAGGTCGAVALRGAVPG
ncbi:hypothetical protein ACH4UX_22990 [Streptomyces althioticus]|uniref:hypothetical protein n=1 Tax=Streptomyces TaxID=1883 RepID=UPI001875087F|nr:hypothetical protein OG872_29505 [Streptomyces althioticus]